MKAFQLPAIMLALWLAGCGSDGGDDPADTPVASPEYDFTAVDTLLSTSLSQFNGQVYVAFKRGDDLLYEFSAGSVDQNTVFGIASATKWISGAVILALAEQGYFSLDDPVGMYLPIFATQGKGHFTIRHAFSMSSGLFDATRPHTNPNLTLEESVNFIALNTPFIFSPPGSAIAYDGKQMQVVGRIAEVVTGKDWRTIAREQLFDKCGMNHTNYDVFGTNPAVAGGISTTASDYLIFLKMVMDGGVCNGVRVLAPESIREMFTNQTNNAPVVETPWPSNHPDFPYGNDDLRYGFGAWILAENPDTHIVEELTSPGAWGTFPWADQRRNLYGVIFTYIPVDQGGFQSVLDTQLAVLRETRNIIDNNLTAR
ncbi:MAG: serine hydrolase domain-containing protein [Pseudomonadota bacterium]